MPRDTLFPFAADRSVVDDFLLGARRPTRSEFLEVSHGPVVALCFRSDSSFGFTTRTSAAIIDRSSTLLIMPPPMSGLTMGVWRRLMAYVCEAVGVSPLSIEMGPIPEAGEVREVRMFQDDKEVEPGLPFMLLGPIGLRAWRANRAAE